jgi:hypothetical protein
MIVNPEAVSQAIFELAFKAGPVVEPLEAEAIFLVLAVHSDLELLLIRELPEVASQAIHPVSLENLSATLSLLAIAMGFSIVETSGVLGLAFESLECPMTLNHVILEISFVYIAIRESLLA